MGIFKTICLHLSIFIFLGVLLGCEQPLSNPESVDVIYRDLEGELKKAEGALTTEEKALEKARLDLADMEPRNPQKRRSTREVYAREKLVERLKQKKLYQQLLLEKRLAIIRKTYPKIYEAKAPWPNPEETAEYQTQKRLQTASRNWNDRVPQLKDRKAPPLAASGEHAADSHGGDSHGGNSHGEEVAAPPKEAAHGSAH